MPPSLRCKDRYLTPLPSFRIPFGLLPRDLHGGLLVHFSWSCTILVLRCQFYTLLVTSPCMIRLGDLDFFFFPVTLLGSRDACRFRAFTQSLRVIPISLPWTEPLPGYLALLFSAVSHSLSRRFSGASLPSPWAFLWSFPSRGINPTCFTVKGGAVRWNTRRLPSVRWTA